jgi:putative hydrolase of the HAD superfamily
MPRALLVDLDDTLLDDRGAMAAAVLQLRAQRSLAPEVDDSALVQAWDSVGRQLWRAMALGQITFQEQRRLRLRQVFQLQISDDAADSLFADYLAHYERAWALLPGTQEFLQATAHLPRVIVTNGNKPQALRKTDKLGLTTQFLAVVTPEDCGARKPDPRIFLHALGLLGVSAEETVMIGDNLEADLVPAAALGMRTFHVNHLEVSQSIRHAPGVA